MYKLLIKKSNGKESAYLAPLSDKTFNIGRAADNKIVFDENKVSRYHARITCDKDRIILEDLGSTFGTYVNDIKISQNTILNVNDVISIGNYIINIIDDEHAETENSANYMPNDEIPDVESQQELNILYTDEMMKMKKRIQEKIFVELNLPEIASKDIADEELLANLEIALDKILREVRHELPYDLDSEVLRQNMMDELIEFGPISPMLRDPEITEIMVNGANRIFVEKSGKLSETSVRFFDDRHLHTIIQRIVEPLGRHVDEASPYVDARLPDGSRVNAVIPPLALDGASVTIRKFSKDKLTTQDLINFGSMTPEIAAFLQEAVRARQNIVISGGTGSGKTTLLNVLSQFIPKGERIVTIEDSAELSLSHRNIVRLETRPPNVEGRGRISIRDLVINALRMRPDRVVVGECRGAEAMDMLQAMNTGHDGSLTTLHANTSRDALSRLENMVMMAGFDLPSTAIREQIASAVNLIVQQNRLPDGSRKILQISEIVGKEGNVILMQDIFKFDQTGYSENGKIEGLIKATGNIPAFIEELKAKGDLNVGIEIFVPKE